MPFLAADMDAFNNDVTQWAKGTRSAIVARMTALNIKHRPHSTSPTAAQKALKNQQRKKDGLINRVSFKFPRHMVFVAKGVGRGTPISMAGQTNRVAKDWFNGVVDERLNSLADIVADHHGTMVLNAFTIK